MTTSTASRMQRAALWCCAGAGFATLLDTSAIAYATPAIASSIDASTAGVQWLLASYSLTFGLGLVPAGRLGDAYGRRGLFAAGLALFLLGAVASAVSGNIWILVASRLVQGFGAGVISAQVLGVIQDSFHGTERVKALGAYGAAGALAGIVGPLLAGAVLWLAPPDPGWRLILLAPAPFVVVTLILVLRFIPGHTTPGSDASRSSAIDLDVPGILLLGTFVVIVTLPVVDPGLPLPVSIGVLAAAAVIVLALVLWERGYARHGRLPLFAPALLRSRGFVTGNLVALLWFGSLISFSTVTTLYFLQSAQIPALGMAAVLIPASLARLVASRLSSRVYVRLGVNAVTYGVLVEAGGIALVAVASLAWNGWPLLAAVAVIQIALGLSGGVVEPPLRAITLVWALNALGHDLDARVYGPDLMRKALQRASETGTRMFIYGCNDRSSLDAFVDKLRADYAGISIAGSYAPLFRALSIAEQQEVALAINDSKPDVVWVGLGVPRQEKWMATMRDRLDAPVLIGVGAAFDFLGGRVSEAPPRIQKYGLEWAYRLTREPKRLFWRYAKYNPLFVIAFAGQYVRARLRR